MLSSIFEQFVEESPVSVMARGLMERVFAPEKMDRLFETHAQRQYQQDLLFSSQVDLMSERCVWNSEISSCSISSQSS